MGSERKRKEVREEEKGRENIRENARARGLERIKSEDRGERVNIR